MYLYNISVDNVDVEVGVKDIVIKITPTRTFTAKHGHEIAQAVLDSLEGKRFEALITKRSVQKS